MKLILSRETPAGWLAVEESLAGAAYAITVVRELEVALDLAARDVISRHAAAIPPKGPSARGAKDDGPRT